MKERKKPETLRLRGVTPTFTVNDLDASVAYYRDVLGFVVEKTNDENGFRGAELKAGSQGRLQPRRLHRRGVDPLRHQPPGHGPHDRLGGMMRPR